MLQMWGMESVVALFPDRQQAQSAIQNLLSRGFERDRLAFSITDPVAEDDLAQATGVSPELGAPGGSASTIRGALLGLFGGVALIFPVWLLLLIVPSTRIYSNGGLIGMLFGAIGGLALGGLFGALAGSDHGDYVKLLRRMGVPAAQAETFYGGMKDGYVMVIARDPSGERTDEALNVMQRSGAVKLEDVVGSGQLGSERQGHGGH